MTRVRSRTGARSRTGLDLDLVDELRARIDPASHPVAAAMVRAAEAMQPNSLADLTVARALRLAESDPDAALARLARARAFRSHTPQGGFPGRLPIPETPDLEDPDE